MPNKLVLGGFDELLAELAALPETARDGADPILKAGAEGAQTAVQAAYPVLTGELRAGVQVEHRQARGMAAFYQLASRAPHAHIYEFGSMHQRPRATFLPLSEQARRASVNEVITYVEGLGLKVTGNRD